MIVHFNVSDDSGHTWGGNVVVLMFAWKNNMGTVTTEPLYVTPSGGSSTSAGEWVHFPLSDGSEFSVGWAQALADKGVLTLPSSAGDGSTLEPMLGSSDGTYEAGSNHAQGVGSCYLDEENVVHINFNDGSGDTWSGQAGFFATYTKAGVTPSVLVTVTPASTSVPQAGQVAFSASVSGNSNQAVTWSVDGIAGGNATVGTIDSTGIYAAPAWAGTHMVTATSVAAPNASGSATVIVIGTALQPVARNWQLSSGSVTLQAASGGSPYNVTVSWSGVTAIAPDGSALSYSGGSATMTSAETAVLALYDPTNAGGNCVALYINPAEPPSGAQVLLGISSVPPANVSFTVHLPQ
jgi:hypothetical protein